MKKLLFGLLLILGGTVFADAQTVDTTDNVGWSDLTFIVPLTKRDENGKRVDAWSLNIGGGFRMGRDFKRPIDERGVATINYRINKYFTAGTGYMYRRYRLTEGPRLYEHRMLFFLNAEKKWPKVTLRNRALTTYLIKHSRSDTVVYRNRVQISFPIKQREKEVVAPYFANEPFYDFSLKKWFRNDIHIGITRQFTKKFGADFYYLHQGFNTGAIRATNGVGMSFRYRIDRVK